MGFKNCHSPLRFPGGKAAHAEFFAELLHVNGIGTDGVFCEPFCGGAGVALTLLFNGVVERIFLNDFDPCIAAFWYAVLNKSDKFMARIADCEVSVEAWHKHRARHDRALTSKTLVDSENLFDLGFSTFFLSRTNRSGILPRAGMIGGKKQDGKYTLGARFKKDVLIKRIQKIAEYRDRIHFTARDALKFLENLHLEGVAVERWFVFLDPPYYKQGKALYQSFYTNQDHIILANFLYDEQPFKWLLTYDDCGEVRALYNRPDMWVRGYCPQYSAQNVRKAKELLISPREVLCPAL